MTTAQLDLPVLDRAVLDENTMADAALQKELFELYFDHAPTNFALLDEAIETGDRQRWRDGAHALKGAARTLGLMALADAAARAEAGAPSAAARAAIGDAFDTAQAAVASA